MSTEHLATVLAAARSWHPPRGVHFLAHADRCTGTVLVTISRHRRAISYEIREPGPADELHRTLAAVARMIPDRYRRPLLDTAGIPRG